MTTSQRDSGPAVPDTTRNVKRRGLLAAGAALVAGLVARLTETRVSAGIDGDVVLGGDNTSVGNTRITCTGQSGVALNLLGQGDELSQGLIAAGRWYGVQAGVIVSGTTPGAAVAGFGSPISPGVLGSNLSGIGVQGVGDEGFGIFGQIPSTSTANTIAIYAQNYSQYAGSGPGAGGFGVYGLCAKGHGLVGATATAGGAAVVGATNGVAGAYAAALYGPVIIGGALTVVGGPKSAAVPHPDGSLRRLYCLESPESWFEDFGTARLECGRVDVTIDPDFAAVVDMTDYHVFLTAYDADHLLHVSRRTANGFAVEANAAFAAARGRTETDLTGVFSWRVVARRKDIAVERLATVTIPPEPSLPPPLPDCPTRTPDPRLQRQ
jgi:hypothetical protein